LGLQPVRADCKRDEPGNLGKPDAPGQECLDRRLVGRVQDRAQRTPPADYIIGQGQGGETVLVRRFEPQRKGLGEVDAPADAGGALGVGEGVLDRRPHVGGRELRDDGPVNELDHGVDDRLRVDDDADLLGREVEQPVGLDNLEGFIEQSGRVDSDLVAHPPGRVPEGVGGRRPLHLLAGGVSEGAAARGENDPGDVPRATLPGRLQRLEHGRMLGIHRQHRDAPAACLRHQQRPGDDERLLVRKRQRLPRPHGRQHGG
jgi:hypothetical protein